MLSLIENYMTKVFCFMRFQSSCLIFSLLISSCRDKTPDKDCGCASLHYTAIENVRISYAHGSIFTFANDNRLVNSYTLCTPLDTLEVSKDLLVPDFIMSGKMRLPCFEGPTLLPSQPLLEVTEIRRLQ